MSLHLLIGRDIVLAVNDKLIFDYPHHEVGQGLGFRDNVRVRARIRVRVRARGYGLRLGLGSGLRGRCLCTCSWGGILCWR